jgi:ATPase subunit of ABC transporter with duplicated ATPase domains
VLSDCGRAFGERPVLCGINFEISRGQRLAVIGPNGIGKSTLIKILAGDLNAEKGEAKWGYETATGYFPQNHAEAVAQSSTPYDWLYSFCTPSEFVGNDSRSAGADAFQRR